MSAETEAPDNIVIPSADTDADAQQSAVSTASPAVSAASSVDSAASPAIGVSSPAGSDNSTQRQPGKYYCPYAVVALRIVVGALFVMSGFAKAVDPWGFIFKIEEYLAAWEMVQPRTIILVVAIAISAYELVFGFLLMVGSFKRGAPWLLMLSMAFLLPLSAYIWIANPVDDCGCFGEMWSISNAATFWKNVAIVIALGYLCRYNRCLRRGVYSPTIQWIALSVALLYTILISLYGYNIQPMVDFRSYPVGTDLYALLNEGDSGEGADDEDVAMVYERDGVEQQFSIYDLPDSTWTFVRRVAPHAVQRDSGFAIYDVDSEDVTDYAISNTGDMLILVIPESNRVDIAYTYAINEMDKAIRRAGGSMIALIASTPEGIARWIDMSMADYPCYIVEDTSLKQLARGQMSMVYLYDGVIKWKRALSAFQFDVVDALGNGDLSVADINVDDKWNFYFITVLAASLLLLLALTQEFILRLLPKKQKKQLTLQSEK